MLVTLEQLKTSLERVAGQLDAIMETLAAMQEQLDDASVTLPSEASDKVGGLWYGGEEG